MANNKSILYSILDGMPMAVYLKDMNCKITYFNKFAKKFLGLSTAKNSAENNFVKANNRRIKETDKYIIDKQTPLEIEETIKLKNKDSRLYNVFKYPVFDENNEMAGICVIAKDIELEKKAQEQRETYIATLTHDLQNPTLAQINALNLLLEEKMGPLNDEQRNILNLTKDSCTYMLEMLLSLLDTYKFENGDYILDMAPCNLTELINSTCKRYQQLLEDKNISVEKKFAAPINKFISDEQFVRRILNNLFRFMINYSFKDTEMVIRLNKNRNNVKIEIESHGYHIPPKTLNNLFEKYTTHFSKYNTVGVDICLYHSKQIVSALGGKVSIESFDNTNLIKLSLPIKPKIHKQNNE